MQNSAWFYIDNNDHIQGPFPTKQMRRWFETGSFYDDLYLTTHPSMGWAKLKDLYPQTEYAFLTMVRAGVGSDV